MLHGLGMPIWKGFGELALANRLSRGLIAKFGLDAHSQAFFLYITIQNKAGPS